jgi:hypothetical protein
MTTPVELRTLLAGPEGRRIEGLIKYCVALDKEVRARVEGQRRGAASAERLGLSENANRSKADA